MGIANNRASKQLRQLRLLAWIEGISYLFLLLVAMPMKYWGGEPKYVQIAGMIHGVLFVLFCIHALQVKLAIGATTRWLLRVLLTSVVPFGMVLLDRWMQSPQTTETEIA